MTYGAAGVPAAETSAIDDDIELGDMQVSFKDPLTRVNIAIPVRGEACTHASVFDLRT